MSPNPAQNPILSDPLGLYIHIPFCASTCDFCSFYQEKPRRADLDRYLLGMEAEIEHALPDNRPTHTVFWGGGTPGLLPSKDLERLGRSMLKKMPSPPQEWSIEMAPSTVKADKLLALKDLGVNRISMGVQTFNSILLESLGRLHNPKQIYKAYDLIREAGFDNVNLDFIFSIPGQSFADWEADLNQAFRLDPEHLSPYCLTFEEDTALYIKLSEGKVKRDIENEAQFYKKTWQLLESQGYGQYEISNFSKNGYECQHNLDTWDMQSWIGLGPSAASQYSGERYAKPHSLDDWLKDPIQRMDIVRLDTETLVMDSLIFGLRMNKGVDLNRLKQRFQYNEWAKFENVLNNLAQEGYLETHKGHHKITPQGRLVMDSIGLSILEVANESEMLNIEVVSS